MSQLIYGDAMDGLAGLNDNSVDLMIVDGPYALPWSNIGLKGRKALNRPVLWDSMPFEDWLALHRQVIAHASRILRPGGQMVLWSRFETSSHLYDLYVAQGLTHRGFVVWQKANPPPSVRKRTYRSSAEVFLWAVKDTPYTFHFGTQFDMRNIWTYPVVAGNEKKWGGHHPTPKPIQLTMRILENHTNPGDLVVVPFAGSGSECVAAHRMGREFIGWELHQPYHQAAMAWLQHEGWTDASL